MIENESLAVAGQSVWRQNVKVGAYLLGTLVLFFFSIQLMVGSLTNLGEEIAQAFVFATSNPFNGLLIGMLVTAMLQSSSTTTALVVAFVASGSIGVDSGIPIIMGANVGTTITSAIVALGFINKKKEFKRAFGAGIYHHVFNVLTVLILFPLEYYYQFLSAISSHLAERFFSPVLTPVNHVTDNFSLGFDAIIGLLVSIVPSWILAFSALAFLFISILIFRRIVSNLLRAKSPEAFSRFFFKGQWKAFGWGVLTTGAIRSSTITTSVVVPIVAKKFASLKQAAPFILGANLGTTITAFIAVTWYAKTSDAIAIALAHFLFNSIGVLVFLPIPGIKKIPIRLADALGRISARYRLVGFAYLLCAFFLLPFVLIYLTKENRGSVKMPEVTTTQPVTRQY
jgi:sodium-dependent phosphate cotransporter